MPPGPATPGLSDAPRGRPGRNQPLRAEWDPTAERVRRPRPDRPPRPERRKQSPIGRFFRTYGWRAYAIPVLAVLTVVLVVLTATRHHDSGSSRSDAAPTAGARNTQVNEESTAVGAPSGDARTVAMPSGVLPAGGPYTTTGRKTYHVVPGSTGRAGTGAQLYSYTVEVEDGLSAPDFGGDATFARFVDATLANPKSWIGGGQVAFRRVDRGTPDFRVTLTSTGTTRELCGYQIQLESSCYYPPETRVTLNEARWVRGAVSYQGDDLAYRQYAVNHEVGHAIGYDKHEPCARNGALAPVMMQQSFGVANSEIMALDPDMQADRSLVCTPNPWPFPNR
nr:DUF3152 domain-containing protein [Williamsia sterculiae]